MKILFKVAGILSLLLMGSLALAQSDDTSTSSGGGATGKVTFPVAELGNCDSKDACRLYCDAAAHRDACFAFALKAGLMTKEKIDAAKIIISKKGPGSCSSADECRTYCADSSHADECLSFAQDHKIIDGSKASLIKKFVTGEGPGACKSTESCRAYCLGAAHADECKAFAQNNGLAPRTGSTSGMMPKPPRTGSSTPPGMGQGEPRDSHGSTTLPGILKGEPPHRPASITPESGIIKSLPPKPLGGDHPTTQKNDLGASVLTAVVHLLGF